MSRRPPSILIIGAGFGGIGLGVLLRRAGIHSFTILEKADSLGGTWRDNTYPGAACDVPSHLYSFSFAPDSQWSRKWAAQPEILSYLERVSQQSGVTEHILFGVAVDSARWDDESRQWVVSVTDGRTIRADVLVAAVGQLNRPSIPNLSGMGSFTGPMFHTADWPHDVDLTDLRVGVVGTAASAVQVVPALAERTRHLSVFQRSPNWILPRGDRAYRSWEKSLFRAVPATARVYRTWIWANHEARFPALRGRWPFTSIARRLLDQHLAEAVADPELRARLTPDYPVGARRVLSSDDYYPAVARPDVELITEPIARVTPAGITVSGGREIPLDAIVLATGFRSTEFLTPMTIVGRGGRNLHKDDWATGARAHLGLSMPRYPNLFLMYGPHTNLGHNSIVFMLECQARHIVSCIRSLEPGATVEVREDAFAQYSRRLDDDLDRTVWSHVESSWYRDARGRIATNWASGTPRYWWLTRRAATRAYRHARVL